MSATAALDRSRRRMLLGCLVGFGLWQGLSIADRLIGVATLARAVRIVLLIISLAAWAYWSFHLVQMVRWIRLIKADDASAASLNDERVRQTRMKAFSIALFAVMAVQVPLLFTGIAAGVAAQLTILVGCTAAIGGFLILDHE